MQVDVAPTLPRGAALPGARQWAAGAVVLVMIGWPAIKTFWLDHLPVIGEYLTTGRRGAWATFWLSYVAWELITLVVVGLAVVTRNAPLADYGVASPSSATVRAGITSVAVVFVILALRAAGVFSPSTPEFLMQSTDGTPQRAAFVLLVVTAATVEELLYRAFAITYLIERGASRVTSVSHRRWRSARSTRATACRWVSLRP